MSAVSGLSVVFMGTPDFAVPALKAILDSDHKVIAVYAQPPRPKGRGQQVQKSPVQIIAEEHGIPVFNPLSFKKDADARQAFENLKPDVAVVAAYGLILPQVVLDMPRFGCINIHASLLPRWRGASPIQHAIWKGDRESGITIMQMESGLDAGPMILKEAVPITPDMIAQDLHDHLSVMGGPMIVKILNRLAKDGTLETEKQNDAESTYAPMLKKSDGFIDWTKNADEINCQIRALNPWPGVWTMTESGKRLKILTAEAPKEHIPAPPGQIIDSAGHVACGGDTTLRLLTVQPENGKAMKITDAINGGIMKPDSIFQAIPSS